MTLQQKNKEWRIFFVAFFLLLSFISNAATPEELEEEILFVTSYNSDTKYTYDNINTFVETYRQLGGKYSTIEEKHECYRPQSIQKMEENAYQHSGQTSERQAGHPAGWRSVEQFPAPRRREVQTTARILRYGIAQRHPYSGRLY